MADDEPVEVYNAENFEEAHFLRNMLADRGIEASVVGDIPASLPCLWVLRRDRDEARRILERFDRAKAAAVGPIPRENILPVVATMTIIAAMCAVYFEFSRGVVEVIAATSLALCIGYWLRIRRYPHGAKLPPDVH